MASGSFSLTRTGSTSSYANFTVNWSSSSNGSSANSSTLNVAVYVSKSTSSTADTYGSATTSVSVTSAGTQTESGLSFRVKPGGSTLLFSKNFTVPHGDDGSKSVTISVDVGGNVIYANGSKTVTLDTIPRQATITAAPNFNDEENPTISYSNPAGNAAVVQACITDNEGNVQYAKYRDISSTGSSYTFSLTDEERQALIDAIPDGTDWVYVRFYVKTYINGSIVGDPKQLTRKLTVVNAEPEIEAVVKDIGSYSVGTLTNDETVMIKGFNHMHATMSVTLKKSATIVKQTIQNGSTIVEDSTAEFPLSENEVFIFTVTDSFGHTVSKEITIPIIDYITLTCNLVANKPTADGDMVFKISGNYFNNKFGDNGVGNTLAVKWRFKENNGEYEDWVDVVHTLTDNTYEVTVNLTGLNYRSTYTIQAMAADMINTSGKLSVEAKVKTMPVFNWGENNFDIKVPLTVDNIYCSNVFRGALEQGSYDSNTGSDQENATCYRSADLVEIEELTSYKFLVNDVTQKFVVLFYDENQAFISETREVGDDGIFTTVEGTKYINFRCYQADYVEDFSSLTIRIVKMSPIKTKTINGKCIYGSGNLDVSKPGVVLYDNSSGSNGTITLLDDAANYDYFEVFFRTNDTTYSSLRVYSPDGKKIHMNGVCPYSSNMFYYKSAWCTISGTTITPNRYSEISISGGGSIGLYENNLIYITRVIGYVDTDLTFVNADEVSY